MEGALNLTSSDLSKLAACGIPAELAERARLRRVDSKQGGELIGRNGSGDYAGIVFENIFPGETRPREYRVRLDRPPIEYKDGKPKEKGKYLSPPGRGNLLYFVPGTEAEWLSNPALPAIVTEGEKKTLGLWGCAWDSLGDSAEVPRFLPIGLQGVWSWRGTIAKTEGPDGERRNVKGTIPDIQRVVWKGRKVTILFDTNVRENESVQAARAQLTDELRKLGAIVSWFAWPDDTPAGVNGIDDLIGMWGAEKVRHLIANRTRPVKVTTAEVRSATREFAVLSEGHYRMTVGGLGVTFDVDRLRRDHHELTGELCVYCELSGARTVEGGSLHAADFNFSSARARSERAKILTERANAKDLDWASLLEEFVQRVLRAEREGAPGVYLHTLAKQDRDNETVEVNGLVLPRHYPSIVFGDGGSAKSYLALYAGGMLADNGIRVALFDWEMAGEDHRDRLERLFGNSMPKILYVRCERPLVDEVDRLRRVVEQKGIEYSIFDSVAYACKGRPEDAEVAGEYFRAVRQIGGGSLHIAHVNKSETADQKPFGSIFWHNSARSTWYAQRAEETPDGSIIRLGLFNRKNNLGPLRQPIGFTVTFTDEQTTFRRSDVADNAELAGRLSVRQRMAALLRRGSMTAEEIAEEIEADVDTVKRTARRYKGQFTVIEGGRFGLLERRVG